MNNTIIPYWYLIIDGFTLVSSLIGTIISIVFLLTVTISRKERYSIPNLISSNTQLPILVLSGITVYSIIRVLHGDLYGVQTFNSLCIWCGYFVYTEIANIFHSFATQSYYRYVRVMYAAQSQYSSMKTLCIIMIIQWTIIHGTMLLLPLGGFIEFDTESQICSVALSRYWTIWLVTIFVYIPPFKIIAFVYIRLAIFSRQSRKRTVGVTFKNARRELQLIKRMLLLFSIFCVCGAPYSIFAMIALFNKNLLPVYHYRIITCCNAMALAIASNIILWQSISVRQTIMKFIFRKNTQRIHPNPAVFFRVQF